MDNKGTQPWIHMWTIFKVFIEFVTLLLLFYIFVFWPRGMWDLSSPSRDRTHTPCIGRWNATGPPGKSQKFASFYLGGQSSDTGLCVSPSGFKVPRRGICISVCCISDKVTLTGSQWTWVYGDTVHSSTLPRRSYLGHVSAPGLPGSRNMGASTFANTSELPRSKSHTMGVPSKKRDVWKLGSQKGEAFPNHMTWWQ